MFSFLRYALVTSIFFNQLQSYAQTKAETNEEAAKNMNVLLVDPNGAPFLPAKYATITNGSAFFKEEFLPAIIYFPGNKAAKSPKVRLDLLDNTIHYLNDKQEEFIVSQPVEKLIFENPDNTKDYFVPGKVLPIDNSSYKKNWFQVFQQNEVTIYKMYNKAIFEYKPFNSGVLEKTIETYEKFFILKDGILVESKKSKPRK